MVEVIRSKSRYNGKPRKVWDFALEFYRGDKPEVHEFRAYPAMDAGTLSYTLSASYKPERAIEGITRSVRKMLADDDGTPADFRPRRYVVPEVKGDGATGPDDDMPAGWQDAAREGWEQGTLDRQGFATAGGDGLREPVIESDPEDVEEVTEDDADALFVGPTGDPLTGDEVMEALKFENGSSKRRFSHLMDVDDSLTLEVDQLQSVYKKLLSKAADRPTRR